MQPISLPHKVNLVKEEGTHNEFVVEPLYPGYGTTLGNALRRVLLSSVPGAAVTAFKVRGVDHEFSTIPSVREDVIEVMLNLKQLRLRVFSEEPVTLFLKATGEKIVTAADIQPNEMVEIISKDLPIVSLDGKNAEFEMEIVVQQGRGYVPVEQREQERPEIGLIQVDAVYSPIRNVSYHVENVRVGQMTNYDKLTLSVDTDGSIGGRQALDIAARILLDHFTVLLEGVTPPAFPEMVSGSSAEDEQVQEETNEVQMFSSEIAEQSDAAEGLESLGLSSRAINALHKNNIDSIEDLKKHTFEELSKLEGLGDKSVKEIQDAMEQLQK
jgi:DNA-directed RNA polymerase subunit alpha